MLALLLALACTAPPDVELLPIADAPEKRRQADSIVAVDLAGVRIDGEVGDVHTALSRGKPNKLKRVRLDVHPAVALSQLVPIAQTIDAFGQGCERPEVHLSVQDGAIPLPVARVDDLLVVPLGEECRQVGRLLGAPQLQLVPGGFRLRIRQDGKTLDTLLPTLADLPGALPRHEGPSVVVVLREGTVQELVEVLDAARAIGSRAELLVGVTY